MIIYGGHFDIPKKKEETTSLQKQTEDPNFWNDRIKAEEIIKKLNDIKEEISRVEVRIS